MSARYRLLCAGAFFALSFIVYNLNGRCIPTHDTLPAHLLPVALLTNGTLTLDQFGPELMGHPGVTYFYTQDRFGRRVSIYPVVVPLLVTPFFVPVAAAIRHGAEPASLLPLLDLTEKVSASFLVALSVALMWLVLSQCSDMRTAVMLTVAYAFGTETWMISSQALWQHGASELGLAGLLLALSVSSARTSSAAGVLSALLVATRPTNVPFAVAAAIIVMRAAPWRLVPFVVSAIPVLLLALIYNVHTFGNVFGGYGATGVTTAFDITRTASGAAGLLLSPGRGLFCFAPFLGFLPALAHRSVRSTVPSRTTWMLLAALCQFLFFASWYDWTGGECFGPRFLTDVTPVLVLALVPIVERLPRTRHLFVLAVSYSIAVQTIGAFCYPMGGSGTPSNQWSPASVQYFVELRAGPSTNQLSDVVERRTQRRADALASCRSQTTHPHRPYRQTCAPLC